MGRPTNSKKDNILRVRVDSLTLSKLDSLVQENNSNRSTEIRKSIDIRYDQQKK